MITVNEVEIAEAEVDAEVQYHPAASLEEARREAAEALVIRALLLQEVRRLGIAEDADEAMIDALFEREVGIPELDEETCRRFYDNNRKRFRSPDLLEAQHVLVAAPPDDEEARGAAHVRAAAILAAVTERPETFETLAREHSDCPSKNEGGHLGQITPGSTVPEFETFLFSLEEGEICARPVESRYGFHVVRLLRRQNGREIGYEAARERVADYLRESAWRNAVRHYIQSLAGRATISGIDMAVPSSPLLQ